MNDYKTAFYYSEDDSAYIAVIPELPGCMSDGRTIPEAIKNAKEIAEEWIYYSIEDGIQIPEPVTINRFSNAKCTDVASYILEKTGPITTMALEKLTYYCKAWSLAWYDAPVTPDRLEAWKDGPVFPRLFAAHKKKRIAIPGSIEGKSSVLTREEKAFIDNVLSIYDGFSGEELRGMTHAEPPWNIARKGIPEGDAANKAITDEMLIRYYRV